jgi:hypothetical protein
MRSHNALERLRTVRSESESRRAMVSKGRPSASSDNNRNSSAETWRGLGSRCTGTRGASVGNSLIAARIGSVAVAYPTSESVITQPLRIAVGHTRPDLRLRNWLPWQALTRGASRSGYIVSTASNAMAALGRGQRFKAGNSKFQQAFMNAMGTQRELNGVAPFLHDLSAWAAGRRREGPRPDFTPPAAGRLPERQPAGRCAR